MALVLLCWMSWRLKSDRKIYLIFFLVSHPDSVLSSTTFSITTLSTTTFRITMRKHGIQHKNTQHNDNLCLWRVSFMLSVIMPNAIMLNVVAPNFVLLDASVDILAENCQVSLIMRHSVNPRLYQTPTQFKWTNCKMSWLNKLICWQNDIA